MKISIIVPVYNAEAFLEKCVSSLLNQSFQNFELILVDDGSTDGSLALCEEYARRDGRIRVIRQENGGASSARNAGMEAASGDYLTFVDSDDYVEPDHLETLYAPMEEQALDFAVSGCFWEQNGEYERQSNPRKIYGKEEYVAAVCSGEIAYIAAYGSCCKLFRRAFLSENEIFFDTRYRLSEDRLFNLDVMAHMTCAASVDTVGYHYVSNPESLTHTRHKRALLENIIEAECRVWERFEESFGGADFGGDYREYIKSSRIKAFLAMDRYIVDSRPDGSGTKKKVLYQKALPLVKGGVLSPERRGIAWRILDSAVKNERLLLLRLWMWTMRQKQKIKKALPKK